MTKAKKTATKAKQIAIKAKNDSKEPVEETDRSNQQSQLKLLISKGKEQGFLTYHEVNDHLPNDIVDPEQIEDIINMINDMGITVHETPPDLDAMLLNDSDVDEEAAEEAAAALAAVDNEFGRTTDPVRMYMREMGTVDLLTREGEIKIAKRIEDGLNQVLSALADFPTVTALFLAEYTRAEAGEIKITDLISGFIDYSQEAVIPQPQQAQQPNNPTTQQAQQAQQAQQGGMMIVMMMKTRMRSIRKR